jgi:uroporphyrinogen decarboxylase
MPPPSPDYNRFLRVLRRERPDRVPLIELGIHPSVINALLDEPPVASGTARGTMTETVRRSVRVHHRLGYDVVKTSAVIPWDVDRLHARGGATIDNLDDSRAWANEREGPIATLDDVDRFAWPQPSDVDFHPVKVATSDLPDGMGLIGFSGGVLEFAMDLIGMERFMLATVLDPGLVEAVIERVGETIYRVFELYCEREEIKALWLGDDLGHKTGLLVSPHLLERLVFPWYSRYANLAHEHGRAFMMHTCGNTREVMDTLINEVGIDAKHSFEDVIEPVERFVDRWGERIAVLGGVDVHLLTVGDETAIRSRVREILEHAVPRCGYAAGSGNSIPDYVPAAHFLAMVATVHGFNGR